MADELPQPPAGPITETRPNHVIPGSAGRVLVVDDVQCLCEGLRRSLRPSGYEIVSANDGRQALLMAEVVHFDVVLTDLKMPFLPGDELILSFLKSRPDLPCILMTGEATRDNIIRVARMPNVVGILVKPLDHARLLTMLASAVQKSRSKTSIPASP